MDYICTVHILLITPYRSERLQYVCEVLFNRLLGLTWERVQFPLEQTIPDTFILSYGCQVEGALMLADSGFFATAELPAIPPKVYYSATVSGLFPVHSSESPFSFDLLASTFWILTDAWSLQGCLPLDPHGRVEDSAHPIVLNGWHKQPIIHQYAEALSRLIPGYTRIKRQGSFQITLDIDEPWKHAHKTLPIQIGGIAKSLLYGDLDSFKERIQSIFGKKDPFYIFPELGQPRNMILFFLLDHHDSRDGRHTWQNVAYRKLIQDCHKRGFQIGIHPSYTSSRVEGRIAFEKQKLEEIIEAPVKLSRQHFLRYRNPETFEALEACGIVHEYSLCPIHFCGYLRGMAIPFPWYDLKQERISNLMLHPVMVMDRALQKYQGFTAENAWDKIKQEAEICYSYGGEFVILWHNATLSESGEWKGWNKVWRNLLDFVNEKERSGLEC